ncbi:MAG: HNH endonuclease [Olsenella sp.]|nr:HNH endonuclease [Olsenella sp.]
MSRTRKSVPRKVLLSLWARAAGRCELCGKELDVAHAFDELGNFAQVAHINAYSPGGARYKDGMTEDELNGFDNLMLLCHEHHKMIDDNADAYPEEVLIRHKEDWESSIAGFVGGLAPSRALVTTILLPAGGMSPHVTPTELSAALHGKGLYAANPKAYDFAKGVAFPCRLQDASGQIERRMAAFEDSYDDQTIPVAVFALAPQPLLIKLGSLLGGMRDVRIFQPSRVGRGWAWPEGGNPIDFSARQISDGLQDSCHASLVISLSGVINMKTIVDIPNGSPVYELTTTDPDTGIVTSEETVRTFVNEVTSLIDDIHESYPRVKELHVYPAMPASLAVGFGTALRFNLISKYVVHEKADGTFGEALCIGRFDG